MSERFLVNAIQWDDDGVATIVYMDRQDALRDDGNLFRSLTLSITPESALAPDVLDLQGAVADLLMEATQIWRDTPAFVPEDTEDEDDSDLGMGF